MQQQTHCTKLNHTANTLTAAHCRALLHCNTLQHTATHCNTLQHTATHCNTLQHTATHCNTLSSVCTIARRLPITAAVTVCKHTASHRQHTASHCHTLPRTATRWHNFNTLPHIEQYVYYCKEAADNRGSDRLQKIADTVALWLEDADAGTYFFAVSCRDL